ncbi:MAG: FprA family A-type flavoprotein [Deltaproteobacteria bacterium]|nr:FprA family A-type flavoprotein [Deltaproteobacteria bacterium]
MKAVKVLDNVWWVGAIDWNLRNFHGYATPTGSTYNAYLIIDEKVALIDTVKAPFKDELLKRISSVIAPEKIDYVIANHAEMDHAGSLDAIKAAAPKAKFIAGKRGAEDINRHFKSKFDFQVVKTGDKIKIGKRSLEFIETPMVHWPDSMMTYCPEDAILYPNDMFGQHMATAARFDDECKWDIVRREAAKYYANIFMPLAGPAAKAHAAVLKLNINIIAPSHGIIWRKSHKDIMAEYKKWIAGTAERKAVVVYDTMWNSTEAMAKEIADGLLFEGVKVSYFGLQNNDPSEIMTDILEAKGVAIGSPTLNNLMLPSVSGFMNYLKGLKPAGKIGFAFGSHGWAGGGAAAVEEEMKECRIEIISPCVTCKYIPDDDVLKKSYESGVSLARIIKKAFE